MGRADVNGSTVMHGITRGWLPHNYARAFTQATDSKKFCARFQVLRTAERAARRGTILHTLGDSLESRRRMRIGPWLPPAEPRQQSSGSLCRTVKRELVIIKPCAFQH